VFKQARVKEELVVHKDVEQRTERNSDTVRKTEVDIEDGCDVRSTGTTGSSDRSR
jgi:stress response protein YsnF